MCVIGFRRDRPVALLVHAQAVAYIRGSTSACVLVNGAAIF